MSLLVQAVQLLPLLVLNYLLASAIFAFASPSSQMPVGKWMIQPLIHRNVESYFIIYNSKVLVNWRLILYFYWIHVEYRSYSKMCLFMYAVSCTLHKQKTCFTEKGYNLLYCNIIYIYWICYKISYTILKFTVSLL